MPGISFQASSFRGDSVIVSVKDGANCSVWLFGLGLLALIWYLAVVIVCTVGYIQIWRKYSKLPPNSVSASSLSAPHITVIRPVKGIEPYLYECLTSTLRQDYPPDRLTVYICISSRSDEAYPILEKILEDFPNRDLRVFVEDEDPFLQAESKTPLGPNPKIRNMSRAYREAKGDIVWIIDCNIWVGRGVGGRMVDRLCGFSRNRNGNPRVGLPYKFVHHLPIALDVDGNERLRGERNTLLRQNGMSPSISSRLSDAFFTASETDQPDWAHILQKRGGRLEELFLSSSHAKMYTAINTVLIAPCIVGKSNMFRRSHLDYLTRSIPGRSNPQIAGIDYFSHNICEDHLIGDLLWKSQIREERELGEKWGKHALVFGDFAFQPMASMSVKSYIARRVRWLRVRKFTVLAATLVEPGTESLMCSLYGAFALKTAVASLLQDSYPRLSSGLSTWPAFFAFWFSSITVWAAVDWILYLKIHSGATVEIDPYTVPFVRQRSSAPKRGTLEQNHWTIRRPFHHWLLAWLGREILAFPIWLWAIYGGTTVVWRDRTFKVSLNTRVTEVGAAPANLRPKADSDVPYDRSNPGSSSTSRSSSWKRSSENIISARDGHKVRRD